jgi:hypothetical protein
MSAASKRELTVSALCAEAKRFAVAQSSVSEPALFGVTDGKAVGTHFEHKFQAYLRSEYSYKKGSSAKGIDFPALNVDIKVTSAKQPQSSCPFASAEEKIFGLGYSLLIFVYTKRDDAASRTGRLEIVHSVFVERSRTADYQTTTRIRQILQNNGNEDDLVACMYDHKLPVDDIQASKIAKKLLRHPPEIGYLTISNALQWRLQYGHVIKEAGKVPGIKRLI